MYERLEKYRQSVFAALKQITEDPEYCGHCKSYEGAIEITVCYPNFFEQEAGPRYKITLHCYLLGPARHYNWFGESLEICVAQAEADLKTWIADEVLQRA
jgi:hypothetical protein